MVDIMRSPETSATACSMSRASSPEEPDARGARPTMDNENARMRAVRHLRGDMMESGLRESHIKGFSHTAGRGHRLGVQLRRGRPGDGQRHGEVLSLLRAQAHLA